MVQGRPDFSVGVKLQRIWGLREGSVFAIEGLAATVMIGAATAAWLPGMIASELVMVAAVVLLFSHLGNPWAAWRAVANIRRSWISRGTAMIGAFCALGGAAIIVAFWLPLPAPLPAIILVLQLLTATFILFYPGFAMAASAGIPFWNTGLLPVLSCLGGLSSGGAALIALTPFATLTPFAPDVAIRIELGLLGGIAVCILALLSAAFRMGQAARLSGHRLIKVEIVWFWGLAVGAGLLIPAAIYGIMSTGAEVGILLPIVAVVLRLLGDISLRYAILKVGAYEALL